MLPAKKCAAKEAVLHTYFVRNYRHYSRKGTENQSFCGKKPLFVPFREKSTFFPLLSVDFFPFL